MLQDPLLTGLKTVPGPRRGRLFPKSVVPLFVALASLGIGLLIGFLIFGNRGRTSIKTEWVPQPYPVTVDPDSYFNRTFFSSRPCTRLLPFIQYPPLSAAADSRIADALKEFTESVSNAISALGSPQPTVSLFVTYRNETLLYRGFGKARPGDTQNVSDSDIFQVGSITKLFTTTMMYQAIEDGLIASPLMTLRGGLGYPFSLRSFYEEDRWNETDPHLADLASQGSGLPRQHLSDVDDDWDGFHDTEETMLRKVRDDQYLAYAAKTDHQYSNLAFTFLGRAMERHLHVSYEDWVKQRILDPLGMSSSGFNFSDPSVLSKMVVSLMGPPGVLDIQAQRPSGGMYASPADLAKFVAMYASPDMAEYDRVLGRKMRKEHTHLRDVMADGFTGFGNGGWECFRIRDRHWVFGKSGNIYFFSGHIAVVPELRLGVGALINRDLETSRLLAPGFSRLVQTFETVLEEAQPKGPSNAALYAGLYRCTHCTASGEDSTMKVTETGGRLFWDNIYLQPALPESVSSTSTFFWMRSPNMTCFSFTSQSTNLMVFQVERGADGRVTKVNSVSCRDRNMPEMYPTASENSSVRDDSATRMTDSFRVRG